MKKIYISLVFAIFYFQLFAQKFSIVEHKSDEFATILTVKIDEPLTPNTNGSYGFKLKTPINFTSCVVGWQSATHIYQAGNFDIKFSIHKIDKGWTVWQEDDCLINPDQNPQNIYKSDLLFGWDEFLHDSIEFYIFPPENENITELYLILQDISGYLGKPHSNKTTSFSSKSCPEFPNIITRSGWCGSNNSCLNPTYTVTYRPNMTHSIIHHGASPTNYTDGAAIVYSYWNYHVNSNGWEDIGYNYLFDKYGNFFQGRHNPQLPNVDVHGAHAGYSNTYSIGCNFLGDSDSPGTAPTNPQINKLTDFLAWWYEIHKNGLNPTSSASIHLQPADNVWQNLPRISGHRDVYPGGTTCPGNALYAILPQIRTATAQTIANCNDPNPPITEISTEKNWQNGNFQVLFNDQDASGIQHAFYQVLDFNGNNWLSNTNYAFLAEDFNTTSNSWTINSGNWLVGNDEISINTTLTSANIYTNITQNNGDIFLYNFKIKFNESGTNTRAGIHFMCNAPLDISNGFSYLVYLRQHNNKVQIYRYGPAESDYVWATDNDTEILTEIWYDVKIILNSQTGNIKVFKNNILVSSWTDPNPLIVAGNAIMLRAAQCNVSYDDINVYKSRATEETITVGENAQIRYESINSTTMAGKINTILIDNSNNWSEIYSKNIFVDTTTPAIIGIETENEWQTENFTANFNDTDFQSGIEKRYYLVSDFDGENWSANGASGFGYDEFNSMANWTSVAGTWNINDDKLQQTDENVNNSQLYQAVNQDNNEEYIYEFDMKVEGNITNRRAGFHYFSSSTETERGNGYFIFFRLQYNNLEFYKVTNNVFSQEKVVVATITPSNWYNVKIYYNSAIGKSSVYLNNQFIADWTDENPYQTGNYVSFRSGNSIMSIDNFKIFRTRESLESITIGENSDIRFQNTSQTENSAKIYSFVVDSAKNFSDIFTQEFKIDWTTPTAPQNIFAYSDQLVKTTEWGINVNWNNSIDNNSGIENYWYSIGTEAGNNNIIDWTNNENSTTLSIYAFWEENTDYFVNVKAKNGAGLFSEISTSNSFNLNNVSVSASNSENINIYPNPAKNFIQLTINNEQSAIGKTISIIDLTGKIIVKTLHTTSQQTIDISQLSAGIYFLKIENKMFRFIKDR